MSTARLVCLLCLLCGGTFDSKLGLCFELADVDKVRRLSEHQAGCCRLTVCIGVQID